ncbi:MAG: DUF499 domain-containing protein [Thermodesulfovibrionales bacterium]|nr:DUF499 domain-containing protein [Thermodesulfovibrionales bacterium]
MAKLKPWYKVVTPREDLREGKSLDASEFAVHLDKVRLGTAPPDYRDPERFFDRTYLTETLCAVGGEVVRRLHGERTETSAVFNMLTQFGGGKTHALTLLYHLAKGGSKSGKWRDVSKILAKGNIDSVPDNCATAVFVGTEFDSITGRGGADGTPVRKSPWGEIAFQLGGAEAFGVVAEHDKQFIEPKGDVIQAFLPKDRPCLILMDEIINYVSTYRKREYHNKLYNFMQSLSETARGLKNVVLVVSIPASELSYTDKDEADQQRFKNMLDRLGKAVLMSAEAETSEIIRRRLFEWDPRAVGQNGKVLLTTDAIAVCREYAEWTADHRQQIPQWFSIDHAREAFESTYPFHPAVLSVFERKWQGMPRFQQTRGILRLLALWVSDAYQKGFKGAQKDPIIGLGSAPLDDPTFRAAVFEQLGEAKLEGALTTDICGKKESHAIRLDAEAVDTIKKARLHKKVATVIFFESNGGQTRNEASVPEIRLDVAEPELDIGNVETALEALTDACYYLTTERNQYRFSLKENLNKRFADRRAGVKDEDIETRIKEEIQKVFPATAGIERVFFPDKSGQIPDRPVISFIIMSPDQCIQDTPSIEQTIETMTREYGKSARTYKSALMWIVAESAASLREEARKLIAWKDIDDEGLNLDDAQTRQLDKNIKNARSALKESVWRTYKNVMLLGKDNKIRTIDLGLPTSSSAESMCKFILLTLRQTNDVEKDVSPRFLIRNWPPAFIEWSTKAMRDAFFASPQFPRLLNAEVVKDTIARGVSEGHLAYVGKSPDGGYSPFLYKKSLDALDVEISEDMFIITSENAEKHVKPPELARIILTPSKVQLKPGTKQTFTVRGLDQFGRDIEAGTIEWTATGGEIAQDGVFKAAEDEGNFVVSAKAGKVSGAGDVQISKEPKLRRPEPPETPEKPQRLIWSGEVTSQKWMNFYTKVLTKFVKAGSLKLNVSIEATPKDGVTDHQVEETKAALRELGLNDNVHTE